RGSRRPLGCLVGETDVRAHCSPIRLGPEWDNVWPQPAPVTRHRHSHPSAAGEREGGGEKGGEGKERGRGKSRERLQASQRAEIGSARGGGATEVPRGVCAW